MRLAHQTLFGLVRRLPERAQRARRTQEQPYVLAFQFGCFAPEPFLQGLRRAVQREKLLTVRGEKRRSRERAFLRGHSASIFTTTSMMQEEPPKLPSRTISSALDIGTTSPSRTPLPWLFVSSRER